MDLFEHVVPVAFLFGHDGVPHDLFRRPVDLLILFIEDADAFLIGNRVLAIFEINDVAGVGEERRDVRGDDVFVVAESDDERRTMLGGDDGAWLRAVDHH